MSVSRAQPSGHARFRSLLSPDLQFLDDADLLQIYASPIGRTTPWIRANLVSSIDGNPSVNGHSKELSDASDRRLFHLMRALADVILIGATSARNEPYRRHTKQVVVVTRSGDLPTEFFTGIPPLVITTEGMDQVVRQSLETKAEVIALGENEVDFEALLALFMSRGWSKVLCEGGPTLLGSLHTSGLIDEVALTIAPMLVGSGRSLLQEGTETKRDFILASLLQADGNLFTRYIAR